MAAPQKAIQYSANVILKKSRQFVFHASTSQYSRVRYGHAERNPTVLRSKLLCKVTRKIKQTRLAIGTYWSFQFRPEVVTLALKISRIRNSLMDKKNDY